MVENAGFKIICLISESNQADWQHVWVDMWWLAELIIDHPCGNSREPFFYVD